MGGKQGAYDVKMVNYIITVNRIHQESTHTLLNEHEVFSTVPLKSKLALETRDSILASRCSNASSFEMRRIESLDARIESQVLIIEDPRS